jgi:hypothetical protein
MRNELKACKLADTANSWRRRRKEAAGRSMDARFILCSDSNVTQKDGDVGGGEWRCVCCASCLYCTRHLHCDGLHSNSYFVVESITFLLALSEITVGLQLCSDGSLMHGQ